MGLSIAEFRKGFRKHFPKLDAGQFIDLLMMDVPLVHLDIIKLDEWMEKQFGPYEGDMKSYLTDKFGPDTAAFVERAI